MREEVFKLDLEEYPIGHPIIKEVNFPSIYGLQKVKAPVYIYRATKKYSPCVVVTACIHGDEINGMRIAQTLMRSKLELLKGTLIIVPVVNLYGFLNKTRYLPDRKDLNRSFPGLKKGSFGSRFADFIFGNFIPYGEYFIDLHSGGNGRYNIPQIRCDISKKETIKFATKLSIPIIVNSSLRDGSFREALDDLQKHCIVFEGGEGLRIDETITKYGVNLVKSVLSNLKMISKKIEFINEKLIIKSSKWVRAQEGGVFVGRAPHGKVVKKGEVVGELRKISGELIHKIRLENDGVILGLSKASLIMSGDALYNIGLISDSGMEEDMYDDYFDFEP